MEEQNTPRGSTFSLVGTSLHIGAFVAGSAVAFILAGVWLDRKFGTIPLFILLGVFCSFAASGFEVYRIIRAVNKRL